MTRIIQVCNKYMLEQRKVPLIDLQMAQYPQQK